VAGHPGRAASFCLLEGRGGRPKGFCHRQMIDAVRYVADNGAKWADLPSDDQCCAFS